MLDNPCEGKPLSKVTINQALQHGIDAHKGGQIQEADRIYTAILKVQPYHSDANHNMGVLAVGVGKLEQALPFFKQALQSNPNKSQYWLSYIDTLIKLNLFTDAKSVLDQARDKSAKGVAFDDYERKLARLLVSRNNNKNPPQSQVQSLKNLYKDGQLAEVIKKSHALTIEYPNALTVWNMLGAAAAQTGKLDQALLAFRKMITIKPDHTQALNNLGLVLKEQGKTDEALEAFNSALASEPNYAEAHYNMGCCLQIKGEPKKAIFAFNKAIDIKPDYADAHHNLGVIFNEQDKIQEATTSYGKALAIKSDSAATYYNLGNIFQKQAKLEDAKEAYNNAIKIKPEYAEAYNNLGTVFYAQGKLEKALEAYRKSLDIRPDYAEALNNMGTSLLGQGRIDAALDAYHKVLTLNPSDPDTLNNIGNALKDQGDLEAAIKFYNKAITVKPYFPEVHRNLSSLIDYKPNDPQINMIEVFLERDDLSDADRCSLSFTFAKMKEDLGETKAAYTHYVSGGKLRKKLLGYDLMQDQNLFNSIKKTGLELKEFNFSFDTETIKTPIFILGMLRSGTTLVEQIISSHTKVCAAGELPFISQLGGEIITGQQYITAESLSGIRTAYLGELSEITNAHHFITDKMPHNFLYIGLIKKVFPDAKIIHVKRDPSATCWSNFKNYFPANGLGYSYNLNDTVGYYKLYKELMDFWDKNYCTNIYHLDYEKLTENLEIESRNLINYLGISWEEACMVPHKNKRSVRTASQQQVRKKVYRGSSEEWRKFEPFLDGVFDNL